MRSGCCRPSRHHGLAAVELALLLPVFLFLVYGTAELGRALYQYNSLTKAVRDGAQYLARESMVAGVVAPTATQLAIARSLVVYGQPTAGTEPLLPGLKTTDVAITPQAVAPSLTANYISVSASYTFQSGFGGVIPALGIAADAAAPGTFVASLRLKGIGS